jgi:hypothetical protein
MTVIARPVHNHQDLKRFINFPFDLFRKNRFWVPPLKREVLATFNRKRNPAFETCDVELWLAYNAGEVVGRIAGIINHRHNQFIGKRQARFGWVDFIDDFAVSTELFSTVESWARERGAESLHGPLGFNDLDPAGMLIEGFSELGTMATIYNFRYYPEHLEEMGYSKEVDWLEYRISAPDELPPRIASFAQRVARQRKLHFVEIKNRTDLRQSARQVFDLFQDTYQRLYGFVPLSEKQVTAVTKKYFSFINPEYITLVADRQNRLVAFAITIPSLSRALQKARGKLLPLGWWHLSRALNSCEIVDFYLIGVKRELQGTGVPAMILYRLGQTFLEKGIKGAESNPELENNSRIQTQWKFFERRQHKRRRCYLKVLT